MLSIIEKFESKLKFLEIKFEKYPFQTKKDKDINLSSVFELIIDCLENKQLMCENEYKKYILSYDDNMITFNYNKKTFNIYRNPVKFQLFYETKPAFKVYEPKQLEDVLVALHKDYFYCVDKEWLDLNNIINLKKENKNI